MNKYQRVIEKEIDLHGLTCSEARVELDMFLREAREKEWVRIITGKGTYKNGPILRTCVISHLVAQGFEWTYAKVAEGGEGALEVYL